MARTAAQQAAQHIAPALVGGQNAVGNHKGGAADVVGDDPQGDVGFFILAVLHPGDAGDVLHDPLDGVHLKQVVDPLHDTGDPLQTHAGVDVGMFHRGVVAFPVGIELGEHQVPELHIPVAVAAYATGGFAAAVFLAAVKVELGARAAGAGTDLPKVVLLAQADDVAGVYPHFVDPDVHRLVVVLIDRDPDAVHWELQFLGDELPGPFGGLVLKVIAKGEVAQHLKVGAVAGGFAHPLDVGGADALLAGGGAAGRGGLHTQKVLFQRCHAGVDQQEAGVILGHQGGALQDDVAFALVEFEEFFTQVV